MIAKRNSTDFVLKKNGNFTDFVNVYGIDLSPKFEYKCILDVVYFSLSYCSYFIVCKKLEEKG